MIDLRNTLSNLGLPIRKKSYMIGDNGTLVVSSITPHVNIHKRHLALSFCKVREAVVAKIISYHFVKGVNNLA